MIRRYDAGSLSRLLACLLAPLLDRFFLALPYCTVRLLASSQLADRNVLL